MCGIVLVERRWILEEVSEIREGTKVEHAVLVGHISIAVAK